jgi:hypothetical protein
MTTIFIASCGVAEFDARGGVKAGRTTLCGRVREDSAHNDANFGIETLV